MHAARIGHVMGAQNTAIISYHKAAESFAKKRYKAGTSCSQRRDHHRIDLAVHSSEQEPVCSESSKSA